MHTKGRIGRNKTFETRTTAHPELLGDALIGGRAKVQGCSGPLHGQNRDEGKLWDSVEGLREHLLRISRASNQSFTGLDLATLLPCNQLHHTHPIT